MQQPYDTIVIGAGVFGAWTAWHLMQAGRRVLLVDQYGPASARASSGGETRVIRMAYGPDEIYTRMAQHSLREWKRCFATIGQPALFRETGVLWLCAPESASASASLAVLARNAVPHEVLDAQALASRYPQLTIPTGGWAIFEPQSGGLLARRAVQALVEAMRCEGAELQIDKVLPPSGAGRLARIETTSGRTFAAQCFVFACGPWLGQLLPDALGGRIFPTRQEVFYFGTSPGDARFAVPQFPIWLDFERDYYGFPDLDARGFKLAHDTHGEPTDPDTMERAPTPQRIAQARAFLARRFPALADAPLVGSEVCQYENTSNGDLVLDRHPGFDNVWIAGGGSGHGFKLGPAVGEHLAHRMLRDAPGEPRFLLRTKRQQKRREVH